MSRHISSNIIEQCDLWSSPIDPGIIPSELCVVDGSDHPVVVFNKKYIDIIDSVVVGHVYVNKQGTGELILLV